MKFIVDIKDFEGWKEYLVKEGYVYSGTIDERVVELALGVTECGEVYVKKYPEEN